MRSTRLCIGLVVLSGLLSLSSCTSNESPQQRHEDANTPAGKLGREAHRAVVKLNQAAREADQKLQKAAHDAKEGWKEDAQRQRSENTH